MKLKEKLQQHQFIITSEVHPPANIHSQELVQELKSLQGDGKTGGIGPDGIVGDSIATCRTIEENDLPAIYQTALRGKNRLQIQKDLISAAEVGIENLLVFTEDYRITGDSIQEMMFFHVDSGKLRSVLEHIRRGVTVEGHALENSIDFTIGCGVESFWGKNVPELELKEMEEMAKLGTDYFLTTPVFNLDPFEKFTQQIDIFNIPVVAEVMIISTVAMGKFLNRHLKSGLVPGWLIQKLSKAPNKEQASIEFFTDLVKGLKHLCQGIHIISIDTEKGILPYLTVAEAITTV